MRPLVAILVVAAALSAAFYWFVASPQESVSLTRSGGSSSGIANTPLTETAVLFGMLVALGVAGTRLARTR